MQISKKLFSWYTFLLAVAGLAINILLVWMTDVFHIPLYLDCLGTVLVAVIGGTLPGIAVGFLSNCITSFFAVSPDPMTLYYGFLSVLIAAIASWISHKGLLLKWYGKVIAVFSFSTVGGVLGSFVTWILYGFSFGQGISASLAMFIYENFGGEKFSAQFAADISIDLIDKVVTVSLLCIVLSILPTSLLKKFPLGHIYIRENRLTMINRLKNHDDFFEGEKLFRKRSLRTKITVLILVLTTILSISACAISIITYQKKLISQYTDMCNDTVDMMLAEIDGDKVGDYLKKGESAEGYEETKKELYNILDNSQKIKYMYVYKIERDGCHVVFDLDSDGLEGSEIGSVIKFDKSFPYINEVIKGKDIPPIITDDTYGWLMTVYKPVYNSEHNVVAYAAADIDMKSIRTNTYTFFINIVSLLFGVIIIIAAFTLWYCDKRLLEPMSILAKQARNFDYDGKNKENRVRDSISVKTGDELEEVFTSMCRTEDAIGERMAEIKQKNLEISLMQRNIIYTLANMVENRDENTGGHIKRTAAYVREIAEGLRETGEYFDILDDDYIKTLYDSAPLHDIGKVKIPDAILNKPGKLTDEEFALMKTHTVEGGNILKTSLSEIEDSGWLSTAIEMAVHHHEKWDGSGYPDGLKGTDIPLCARIMAVSDVFDALVSERSYKHALSYDDAIKIIKDGSGSHFDPQITEAFIRKDKKTRDIIEKYK